MQTLLQSEENYYNSKRANTQSFQNFIRILIVAFFAAFIANTPWDSLHAPALAYIGTALLLISMILNIDAFPEVTQMAKNQQSTQQASRGGREEKRSWDTPSRPITPTPVKPAGTVSSDPPTSAPTQPTPVPTQPPAKPASDPQSGAEK